MKELLFWTRYSFIFTSNKSNHDKKAVLDAVSLKLFKIIMIGFYKNIEQISRIRDIKVTLNGKNIHRSPLQKILVCYIIHRVTVLSNAELQRSNSLSHLCGFAVYSKSINEVWEVKASVSKEALTPFRSSDPSTKNSIQYLISSVRTSFQFALGKTDWIVSEYWICYCLSKVKAWPIFCDGKNITAILAQINSSWDRPIFFISYLMGPENTEVLK